MSDHLEHSRRWQHRTHAAVTTHWHGDQTAPGRVEDCEVCTMRRLIAEVVADCEACNDHEETP